MRNYRMNVFHVIWTITIQPKIPITLKLVFQIPVPIVTVITRAGVRLATQSMMLPISRFTPEITRANGEIARIAILPVRSQTLAVLIVTSIQDRKWTRSMTVQTVIPIKVFPAIPVTPGEMKVANLTTMQPVFH